VDSALTTSVKQKFDQSSSEPWQGAQIVPALDFPVSQISSGKVDFDICRANPTGTAQLPAGSTTEGLRYLSEISSSPSSYQKQHLGIRDDTLLPLPSTPSISDMADHETMRSSSQVDYAALVIAARDKARAKYNQSPGMSELERTQEPLTATSQMLPVRENTTATLQPAAPTGEATDCKKSRDPFSNGSRHPSGTTSKEHIVFLPLPSMVRDIYYTELKRNRTQILAFLDKGGMDPTIIEPELLNQINGVIEKLKMITDHQDLPYELSPTSTQQSLSLSDDLAVKWAATCSPKCLFLQQLLRKLRIQSRDIVIVARPGRMLDILELILKEENHTYNRLDRPAQLNMKNFEGLTITLIPSGLNEGQDVINRADAIIAFDDTSRLTARFSNVAERSRCGLPSPVISLVVSFSPDHIELCLPRDMDRVERTLSLVNFVVQTREALGQLSPEFSSPEEAATAVAGYLRGDESAWPLQSNLIIPGLGPPISHSTEESSNSNSQTQNQYAAQQPVPQGAMKRSLVSGVHPQD
jgi:hypothetical protein